jgi:hypothetical protein
MELLGSVWVTWNTDQIGGISYYVWLRGLCAGVSWFCLLCFLADNHDTPVHRPRKKLPDDGRLLPKHASVHIVGHFYYPRRVESSNEGRHHDGGIICHWVVYQFLLIAEIKLSTRLRGIKKLWNNEHYIFWMCVCSLIYPARKAHAPHLSSAAVRIYSIFSDITSQTERFSEKGYWTSNVCFDFLNNLVWNISHSKKNCVQCCHKRPQVFIRF